MGEPLDVNEQLFQEIVREADVPVLVDFWAEWCAPCRAAAPEVKELAREMAGKALVLKVDTEREQRLASQFRIQGIPNFVVLHKGNIVMQRAGLAPRAEMRRWLEAQAAA